MNGMKMMTHTVRELTEQGLSEDDVRRRDEEANVDRMHLTNATEKNNGGKTLNFLKNKYGPDARDVGKHSELLDYKEAMK